MSAPLLLTPAERACIASFVRLGSLVAVAVECGRSIKTLEVHMRHAREKNGGVSLIQLAVLADRENPQVIVPAAPVRPSRFPASTREFKAAEIEADIVQFFERNPDEELTSADACVKYGRSPKSLRPLLKSMFERELISRRVNRHGVGRGAGRIEHIFSRAEA